jgi:hypothetical protein
MNQKIRNFVGEHRVRTSTGSLAVYTKGDVVTRRGKTYIATKDNVSGFSPEHGSARGWEPLSKSTTMNFTNSDTAPEQPNEGDHWFDSSGGTLYIYLADKDTNQWVEI